MKHADKKTLLIIVAVLLCALSALLFGCEQNGTVTSFTLVKDSVSVSVGGTMKMTDCFLTEGNGKIFYTVENSDVVSVDKGVLKGLSVGEAFVTVSAGEFYGRIKVTVYDPYIVKATLRDEVYEYDGETKTLTVNGALPEGTTVRYFVGEEEFFGASVPGVYKVRAEITLPEKYSLENPVTEGTLTINRANIAIDVAFPSAVYDYDGEEKSIYLKGDIPDGVTVQYSGNKGTDAGVYNAKAEFFVDERFYEPIRPMSAILRINKKPFSVDDPSLLENRAVTYDGQFRFSKATLNEQIEATYFVFDVDKEVSKYVTVEEYCRKYQRAFVDCGTYRLRAVFAVKEGYEKNYARPDDKEYVLTINKADFFSDLRWKGADKQQAYYDAVYDGEAKIVGEGSDFGGLEGRTEGVNGEYPEGAVIKYFYGADKTLRDSLSFTDAGVYLVTATFIMPEGSEKNYYPLPDISYAYVIKKADYYADFSFGTDEYGEDFSTKTSVVYDAKAHCFSLNFSDEAAKAQFLSDVKITYYVNKNSSYDLEMTDCASVKNVGSYSVGYRLAFRDPTEETADQEYVASLKKNYALPADGAFTVTITPMEKNLDGVRFDDGEFVYDGTAKSLEARFLPDGVSVRYENNGNTEAGIYSVKAVFFVSDDLEENYCFVVNGTVRRYLTATATIEKARYDKDGIESPVLSSAVYDDEKTLADYPLPPHYRWAYENTVPTCDKTTYLAYYNDNPNNFYDLNVPVTLTLAKKTVDLSTASVESRFLPYTGNPVFPIVTGEVGKYLVVNATCIGGEEHTDVGRYVFGGITLSLKDEVNFSLIGEQADFGTVTVHVYDGKIYEYDKNCLVRYTGMESAVNVPEGTESVFNGAFDKNYGITELSLPDSIKSLSSGALKNMQGLQSLSLPFLGTSLDESLDGVFSSVFGGSVPETLIKVTVTCSTVIHNGAFKNCSGLKRIEYKNEVTAIGEEAFYGCSSLLYAIFPSASSVGSLAFYGCKGLEILDLPVYCDGENGTVSYLFGTNAGDNSYFRYALKELFLANGTFETVASNAFAGLSGLTKIVLPVTVQSLGYGAFSSVQAKISFAEKTTSDESVWTESSGKYHSVGNGAFAGFKGATLSLPETVTSIGKEAFKDATLLSEIRIPASVSEIEEYAFYGTSARIVFADESAYSVVKSKTFAYYAGEGVILPSSVTTVESYAFINSKIRSAKMSATISYGNNVYENCAEMIRAEIYGSVIPSATFKNCVSLKTVRIDCAERIEGNAFYGCSSIEETELPSTVAFIGSGAFYGCSSLKTFVFKMNALPDIGEKAFFDGIKISVYVNDAEIKKQFSDRFYPEYSNIDFYVA